MVRSQVGCGGFVQTSKELAKVTTQSKMKMNYSFIKVSLHTEEGIMKESVECAPNGYYFIPVYDKGSYRMRVQGPEGWNFEPQEVIVSIQEDNQCEGGKDVNFQITGFQVSGQVSSQEGHLKQDHEGPAGITITLSQNGISQTATTSKGGSFTFRNVFPGVYSLSAQHPTWAFSKAESRVSFEWGNHEVPANSLVIAGYDVQGRVEASGGEPVPGVQFFLYSDKVREVACPKPVAATPPGEKYGKLLCGAASDASGRFILKGIPPGTYKIVPFYKGNFTTFDVLPHEVDIVVQHGTFLIQNPFQVMGFSVRGRVLTYDGRSGVKGVAIQVDGKTKAITDEEGYYKLEQMSSGNYNIQAHQDHIFFSALVEQKMTPNLAQLPDIFVTKYHLCGTIAVTLPLPGLSNVPNQRKIVLSASGVEEERTTSGGRYCFEVKPGTYKLIPVVSAEEVSAGLLFSPRDLSVIISNTPVLEANFIQAQVSVSGSVKCIESPCHPSISVILSSVSGPASRITTGLGVGAGITAPELLSGGGGGETGMSDYFVFRDVLPGTYVITINQESWCWQEETASLDVQGDDISNVEFVQSGYLLSLVLSHDIVLEISNSSTKWEKSLKKGVNKICLSRPGIYQLTPKSCFLFSKETFVYDTSAPKQLELTATKYLVNGSIVVHLASKENHTVSNLRVDAKTVNAKENTTHPLKLELSSESKDSKGNIQQLFQFSYWIGLHDVVTFLPSSTELLFYPPERTIQIEESACPDQLPAFQARPGLFIKGQVTPPFPNIKIFVQNTNTDQVVFTTETQKGGEYVVGPLYDDQPYQLHAEKDGYSFQADEKNPANFHALRLAKVKVSVVDETGQPLGGVLVTLTGDGGFRSNNLTLADGTQTFANLVPGQFFLRIQLKEYVFDPSTKSINMEEGESTELKFNGQRVAFSCFGKVQSLNGEPEKFVMIEARSDQKIGSGSHYEETQSDGSGAFRLRGLLPGGKYTVAVKSQPDRVERSTPSSYQLEVKKADIHGFDFIIFKRSNKFDLTGELNTSSQWLQTVQLELYTQQNPEQPLKVITFPSSSPLFEVASLPRDTKYFFTVKTSLSPQVYSFNTANYPLALNETSSSNPSIISHSSAHHIHVVIPFSASLHPLVQEHTPASAPFTLILGILLIISVFYHERLLVLVKDLATGKRQLQWNQTNQGSSDEDEDWAPTQKKSKKGK